MQIKNFTSIVASMGNYLKAVQTQVTDFSVGSVTRTLLEATAIEIEELYQQMLQGLVEAIQTAVYYAFGFPLLEAVAAHGYVRITFGGPVLDPFTIPAGTVFVSAAGLYYVSDAAVSVAVGATTAAILVTCSVAGTKGSVAVNSITTVVNFDLPDGASVGNDALVGSEGETESARLLRFQAYIRSLARGTPTALAYAAKSVALTDANGAITEQVKYAYPYEPYVDNSALPPAWVQLYVHNGVGGTSAALVAEVARVITGYYQDDGTLVPGWKAAGVKVDVLAAAETAVHVAGTVSVLPGYLATDVCIAASSAVQGYMHGLSVGESVLVAEIVAVVKRDVPGVADVHLDTPAANVAIDYAHKAIAGIVAFS